MRSDRNSLVNTILLKFICPSLLQTLLNFRYQQFKNRFYNGWVDLIWFTTTFSGTIFLQNVTLARIFFEKQFLLNYGTNGEVFNYRKVFGKLKNGTLIW